MRISHKHKFVFISNVKCASSSIRSFLNEYSDIISFSNFGIFRHHVPARELVKCFYDTGWKWNEYLKFSTIRNPWSRAVSQFFYKKKEKIITEQIEFSEWILNELDTLHHLHSDYFFLSEDGKMLIDKVIKVEDLEVGMSEVCNILHIPMKPIDIVNTSDHEHYVKYYTPETIRKVGDLFRFDVELGNYQFGQ